jgi:hypothetical protein
MQELKSEQMKKIIILLLFFLNSINGQEYKFDQFINYIIITQNNSIETPVFANSHDDSYF